MTTEKVVELKLLEVKSPVSEKSYKREDDRPVTMGMILAAFALFKQTLDKSVLSQSKTQENLFLAQDKALDLSAKAANSMGGSSKMEHEKKAAKVLSTIGTILGVVGTVLCFLPPPFDLAGFALVALSGACMVVSGALQIDAAKTELKIADQQGKIAKYNAVAKTEDNTNQGATTQLNDIVKSKTALEQAITEIIRNYGEASRSAGSHQSYGQN